MYIEDVSWITTINYNIRYIGLIWGFLSAVSCCVYITGEVNYNDLSATSLQSVPLQKMIHLSLDSLGWLINVIHLAYEYWRF